LLEQLAERPACRLMVELATADLAAGAMPDMAVLRARFAPDPAQLPDVVVHLTPLAAYKALLECRVGEAA
jgi:hypothetical protein